MRPLIALAPELLNFIRDHKILKPIRECAEFFKDWPLFFREQAAIACGHALISIAKEAEEELNIDADNAITRQWITWFLAIIFTLDVSWKPTWPPVPA